MNTIIHSFGQHYEENTEEDQVLENDSLYSQFGNEIK